MQKLLLASVTVAAGLALAPTHAATITLFDSGGFENPGYTTGTLAGQNGWVSFGTGVGTVQNSVVQSGSQAVALAGNSASGFWEWPNIGYTPLPGDIVQATAGVRRGSSATATKNFGFFFDAYGSVNEIGRIGIVESAGGLYAVATTISGGTPGNYAFASGLAYDTWYDLRMDIKVSSQTFDFYINGSLIGANLPFLGAATDVADVDLQLQGRAGATDIGYFDNYKIVAVTVPEPSAISLAAVGALALAAIRRRAVAK